MTHNLSIAAAAADTTKYIMETSSTNDEDEFFVSKNFSCGKWNLTKEENEFQEVHGWWIQSFASLIIGSFGILVNMVTILVLSTKELRKLFFNKLLIGLTIFDNLFLFNCLYESVRLHIIKTDYCALHGHLLIVLRPFRYISMCCSIYMTLVLTFERYLAVVRPIRHRNRFIGSSHGKRLIKYVSPVVILSIIFCTPQFFALDFAEYEVYDATITTTMRDEDHIKRMGNMTSGVATNATMGYADFRTSINDSAIKVSNFTDAISPKMEPQMMYCLQPSDIMFNRNYVLWYKNVANLIITGTIPFFLLAFFNYKIYLTTRAALQTREELFLAVESSTTNPASHKTTVTTNINGTTPHCNFNRSSLFNRIEEGENKEQKNEEHSQATVLLGIVIAFFICHVLRIVLNVEEIVTFEELNRVREEADEFDEICSGVQLWTMLTNDVSHLLLQLNSSITFFIYIYFSTQFQEASKSMFIQMARYLHLYHLDSGIGADEINEGVRCRNYSFSNTKSGTYVMNSSYSTPPPTVHRKRSKNQSFLKFSQKSSSLRCSQLQECDGRQTNANTNHGGGQVVVLEQFSRGEMV